MTSIDSQLHTALSSFFNTFLFSQIPVEARTSVAAKLTMCTFRPGETLYTEGELPLAVHYIVEGKIRVLGPTSSQSPTLAVLEEGAVVGWDNLLRRIATGSVRAAGDTAVKTLALPADDFEALACACLETSLTLQVSTLELYDVLSHFFELFSTRLELKGLRDAVNYIEHEQLATVMHWFSASTNSETQVLRLPSEKVWLVSSRTIAIGVGKPVTVQADLQAPAKSPFPVRLVGIDQKFLAGVVLKGTLPSFETVETSEIPLATSSELLEQSRSAIALLETHEALEQQRHHEEAGKAKRSHKNYPIRYSREVDPIEDLVACLWMVTDYLKVPFHPDLLRQYLQRRENVSGDSLEFCQWIAEALGLKAQMVKFTPSAGGFSRLEAPALILQDGIPTVLYHITREAVTSGSPRQGLATIHPDNLAEQIAIDAVEKGVPTSRALVLHRQARTPLKQFGISWFLPILKDYQGVLLQVLVASVFVQILGLANPLLVQQIIDKVIINSSSAALPMFGILMVAFSLLEAILTVLRSYLFSSTTNRVDLTLGAAIIRHLLHLPLNFFEKRPVGELSARLSELENIRQFFTGTALTAVLDFVFSLLYIGVMLLYSVTLTLCVLASIPIVIVLTLFVSALLQKLIRRRGEENAKVQSHLIENISGIFTVKSQNMEGLVEAKWRDSYKDYLTTSFRSAMVSTTFGSISNLINTLNSLLVLWVGAGLVLKGDLTLGGLIAFRIIAGNVSGPMVRLARLGEQFQKFMYSIELLADINDTTPEELPEEAGNLGLPPIEGWVQYENIRFGFKPGQLQLANVNLEVTAGAFVGVVGQSGSGKSTLVKLLPRLYLPNDGKIYVDGYDISKVSLRSLRQQVGIVPQDSILFEGSVRDNITRQEEYTDEEVIEAARVADAHDFIMTLQHGYKTPVGERGAGLSGGQRQRIAIARMVLQNPRLLILDEATSALDYTSERRVCLNLAKRFQGRTVFFITHRLNTIRSADCIVLMEQGCVMEQGTHDALMAAKGRYYCLFEQQRTESM